MAHAIAITNCWRLAITISKSQAFPADVAVKSQCRNHRNRVGQKQIAAIRNHTPVVATISGGLPDRYMRSKTHIPVLIPPLFLKRPCNGEKMAGTNEPFCFAVEAYYVRGGGQNQAETKFEKCLPAGTGTKAYFSSNCRSLAFSERSQLLQAILQLHMERMLREGIPIARFKSQYKEGRVYGTNFYFVGWGRYDCQRKLVIRIAAATQKTREGCGCLWDAFEGSWESLRKIAGKCSRIARCYKF